MSQTKVMVAMAGAAISSVALAGTDAIELRADAANRTSQLAPVAGYTNGFFEIGDGANNVLRIGGTTTTRLNLSFRDDSTVGDQDDFTQGFNLPVQRLRFHGTIWDKNLSYKIQGNFSDENPGGGTFALEEAWGAYDFENGFTVKWGQQNLGLHRVQLVDREYQQAMDRSIAYAAFSSGYVQGAQFAYNAEQFRVIFGFHDGIGGQNADFNSAAEADFGVNARVEFMAMGTDWNTWNYFSSWKSASEDGLLIGAGVNYQTGGETGGTADVDVIDYTIDAQWKSAGWNIFAAMYGTHIDPAGGTDFDNFGGEVSAGFFVTDQVELFGRWDGIFLDDSVFGGDTDVHFGTVGVHYFLSPESHAVRFTFQAGYAFNDTTNVFGSSGIIGDTRHVFLGDSEEGEFTFAFQGQVIW
ncbi:MAG: porin [Planctomycetota bacterium]|nr:porin [Planctomycetota bacterium]